MSKRGGCIMRLSYNKVFDRYYKPLSDKLAEITYCTYKSIRLKFEKLIPLSEIETHSLKEHEDPFSSRISDEMPAGFDYINKKVEEGFVKLDYLDVFDYLPKENVESFLKEVKKCVSKNKVNPFGVWRNNKDIRKLDNLAEIFDGHAFSHILTVEFIKDKNLKKYCPHVQISLMNLSPTFLVVKYRLYISKEFNALLNQICKNEYAGYKEVCRQFNVPWYKPKKFGMAFFEGNNTREKHLYKLISKLKWDALKELRKYFKINFFKDNIFPPVFETYSTNIRPNKEDRNLGFWNSIMFDRAADYAPTYNACVCWDYKLSNFEGIRLAAYCGGKYSIDNHLPEIAHHDISDIYAVYLTACTLDIVAQRDIAVCNKKISKAIRKTKNTTILKVRVDVDRKLYYSYRFINEFSGNTIERDEAKAFRHEFYKDGSVSSRCLNGVPKRVKKSKEQIDSILTLLNDAAEYRSSASNIRLQWVMMFVTILSLIIALISINDNVLNNFIGLLKSVCSWLKNLM